MNTSARPMQPVAPTVWGEGGVAETISDRQKRINQVADALYKRASIDTSPVGSWAEGLSRVANSAAQNYRAYQDENDFRISQTTGEGLNKFPGAPLPPSGFQQIGAAFKSMFR